jgi:hypothetical protein
MMANSKESDLVEAALNEAIKDLDGYKDGDLLVDWAVVCFVAGPDKEAGSGYPMLFSNGDLPNYRAKGLLVQGLDILRRNEIFESVEPDEE